jgi:hypothetical protein
MHLTAPAGKVFGLLVGFVAVLTLVSAVMYYWQWTLVILGLVSLPSVLRDNKAQKMPGTDAFRIEQARKAAVQREHDVQAELGARSSEVIKAAVAAGPSAADQMKAQLDAERIANETARRRAAEERVDRRSVS